MKPAQITIFLLAIFALLFGIWFAFPSKGVEVAGVHLRFPNYESYKKSLEDKRTEIDVDSVLLAVDRSYEMVKGSEDTLAYYYNYLTTNPNRIYMPGDDYHFLDSFFEEARKAHKNGTLVRILHYGDSQIEMDRISSVLRQDLQERFGGSGPGMVPMIQRIPIVSVSQKASGSLTRYAMVGDSLTNKASNHRYGPLTQFCTVSGNATFSFFKTNNRYSKQRAKEISKIGILLGYNSDDFTIKVKCDTLREQARTLKAKDGVTLVSMNLGKNVSKGTISFSGTADVYGILLDGGSGVTVDNAGLRGCAGFIFSSITPAVMKESFAATDTRLILMQFGGNAIPGIYSKKAISAYAGRIVKQFDYFKKVAPKAKILFIGPSDMGKSVDGEIVSWPLLKEMNDSLKASCLNNGVAYWDTFNVMGGAGSMKRWVAHNPPYAGPDYIHFTNKGAEHIGNALARSFLLYDDFYDLRQQLSDKAVMEYMNMLSDSSGDQSALPGGEQ